ncbi:YARHG domain-containing protein [Brotaphodocola sp.]|uniref:YARHG domain-containing protein n=1 Tax=Brotaphodocola sp. TaxID=3073577 RepID=UPI003D7ED2DA
MMFCGKCGKQIDEKAKFCPYCGAIIETDKKNKNDIYLDNKTMVKVDIALIILIVGIFTLKIIRERLFPFTPTNMQILYELSEKSDEELLEESSELTTETEVVQTVQTETAQPTETESTEYESIEVEEEADASEYILPECDTRIYSKEELQNLSKEQLRLARNEIYARHGRKFSADDLNAYFSSKSWYTPLYEGAEIDAKGDSILNQNEIANRNLIVELEAEK